MSQNHIPAPGRCSGLHGEGLCGEPARFATGDHELIRRLAVAHLISGRRRGRSVAQIAAEWGLCPHCLAIEARHLAQVQTAAPVRRAPATSSSLLLAPAAPLSEVDGLRAQIARAEQRLAVLPPRGEATPEQAHEYGRLRGAIAGAWGRLRQLGVTP